MKLAYQMTKTEIETLRAQIEQDLNDTRWSTPKTVSLSNRDTQIKLEQGKLDKLNRTWERTQLPTERLMNQRNAQRQKVQAIKDTRQQELEQFHTIGRQRAAYLLEKYPSLYVLRDDNDWPYIVGNDEYSHIVMLNGHKHAIRKALREGKEVPPEVLADYPDIDCYEVPE